MLKKAAFGRGACPSSMCLGPATKPCQGANDSRCSSLLPPCPFRAERMLLTPVFHFTDSLPEVGYGYVEDSVSFYFKLSKKILNMAVQIVQLRMHSLDYCDICTPVQLIFKRALSTSHMCRNKHVCCRFTYCPYIIRFI